MPTKRKTTAGPMLVQFRLRTLLILLIVGPLVLAWGWSAFGKYRERERLREAPAIYEARMRVYQLIDASKYRIVVTTIETPDSKSRPANAK